MDLMVERGAWRLDKGDLGLLWVAWGLFQSRYSVDNHSFVHFLELLQTKRLNKKGRNPETKDNKNPLY